MSDASQPVIPLDFTALEESDMRDAAREFYKAIRKRRTVREFSDRAVEREIIENALRAAGTAPSGANMQPWHFVVIGDPEIKAQIRKAAEIEEHKFYKHRASDEWLDALLPFGTDEYKPFLETAPYLIVVFLKKFSRDEEGNRLKNYYTAESVGIATGILITALHTAGLATLTHTPSPMKFLNKLLGRPSEERPYVILVTGYPADGVTVPDISKKELHEIATFL